MLLNYHNAVAYRCFACENLLFEPVSIFDFFKKRRRDMVCSCCGTNNLKILKRKNSCQVTINCIDCGGEHIFNIKAQDFWSENLAEHSCLLSGNTILITGGSDNVKKGIKEMEDEFDPLYDEQLLIETEDKFLENLDNIFISVNYIHELARKNKLICDCGCTDISISAKNFCLYLHCDKCENSLIIQIGELEDVSYIKNMKSIQIKRKKG